MSQVQLQQPSRLAHTLRNAAVVHDRLVHLNGVVLEIQQNFDLADSELLFAALLHALAEEGIETKNLAVKRNPGRQLPLACCLRIHACAAR